MTLHNFFKTSSKYYPLRIFITFWLGMFILRYLGLMEHDNVSINTYLAIIYFCTAFFIGSFLGIRLPYISIKKRLQSENVSLNNLNLLIYLTVIMSFVCCITQLLKLKAFAELYNVEGVLLEMFSEIRRNKMDDTSNKLGGNIYGVISNVLYGFPVLAIFIFSVYKSQLNRAQTFLLIISYLLGLFISFTNGGRFTAFAFILMYYFLTKIHRKSRINKITEYRSPLRKFVYYIFIIGIFYVFGQIFIVRLGSQDALMNYLEMQDFNRPKQVTKDIIHNIPLLSGLLQFLMIFDYYITHSIDQLNYLLSSSYPINAPYLGAYQFSAFVLFLNKLGTNIKTTDLIDAEIPNPGVYFSMIGGVYLDFGKLGIFWFSSFIGILSSISYKNFLKKRTLSSAFWSCIFLVIISISPIISMIGTGYFSSIIAAGIFLFVFNFRFSLPPISYKT